jgi:hypothetical protein
LYGAFVCAHRALHDPNRRVPARAECWVFSAAKLAEVLPACPPPAIHELTSCDGLLELQLLAWSQGDASARAFCPGPPGAIVHPQRFPQ